MQNFKELLRNVKAFAFDVDGVFTDGTVILHPSGDLLRSSNTRDGYAVHVAIEKGFPAASTKLFTTPARVKAALMAFVMGVI